MYKSAPKVYNSHMTVKRVTWVTNLGVLHRDLPVEQVPEFCEALEMLGFDGEIGSPTDDPGRCKVAACGGSIFKGRCVFCRARR